MFSYTGVLGRAGFLPCSESVDVSRLVVCMVPLQLVFALRSGCEIVFGLPCLCFF